MSDLSCRCKECRPDLWPKNEDGSDPAPVGGRAWTWSPFPSSPGTYGPDPTRADWEAYLRSGQDEYRTRARMEEEVERQLAARPLLQRETLADILQRLARRITNGDDGRD